MVIAVKERKSNSIQTIEDRVWSEAVAFCPQCKALQTVWVDDDILAPTRKFFQVGSQIFHDCGSTQPCRLYYTFRKPWH